MQYNNEQNSIYILCNDMHILFFKYYKWSWVNVLSMNINKQ